MQLAKNTAGANAFSLVLGTEISRLRRARSITGKALGNLVGVSQQQMSRYERGVCEMTLFTLCQLLHGLDVSLEDFFYSVATELKSNSPALYAKYRFLFLETEAAHAMMVSLYSKLN
ncbi:helix-turn-helix domain-containing protein (plasmid) [Providencia rettgeri]|uniref:helix-turn-helix domain-containing protein n=1 Tax=Providencia rettgeri TaxID=587 RepID=UPI001CA71CD2|nr:helix-turn-helix transcriptional regulator [Providencia rettgeri]QZY66580.1 helix-turn-helix domain-containing protein [Providencia rettgeri]